MYSRNFSRRTAQSTGGSGGRADHDPVSARVIPPPDYSGTLYISRRGGTQKSESQPVRISSPRRSTAEAASARTVMYNGQPYTPDDIGMYSVSEGPQSAESEVRGRGGRPGAYEGEAFRMRKGKKPDAAEAGEAHDLRASVLPQAPDRDGGDGLLSLFDGSTISAEDIVLVALIITLLGTKEAGGASDDLLIIILTLLLFTGKGVL